jgi:hypothetical protein
MVFAFLEPILNRYRGQAKACRSAWHGGSYEVDGSKWRRKAFCRIERDKAPGAIRFQAEI